MPMTRNHTVNPLLSPSGWVGGGAYLFQVHLSGGGGLIEAGDLLEMGDLFNLEKTMVSVLHKELEQKVEDLKNKRDGGHAAEDQNQIRTSSW